jgi:hypothetical protein
MVDNCRLADFSFGFAWSLVAPGSGVFGLNEAELFPRIAGFRRVCDFGVPVTCLFCWAVKNKIV